jgi:N-acetylglucosamine-6-phosphate deacetylase
VHSGGCGTHPSADGIHVHDASIALAKKLKEQMCFLVTDAVAPVGTSLERFTFGGKTVYVRDDKCVSPDGTLGGSLLTLNAAIRNCVRRVGLTLLEAVRMATLYPARALGLERCLGKVQPGYEASLAIFDSGFRVRAVVDRGKLHLNPVASPHELEPHA